jgi:anti-sigma regulatory factor (Ser/Thr protein kinase)
VTAARREFTSYLRSVANSEANLDAAALIFGELIANAIMYGRDPITVSVDSRAPYALLIVEDGGLGFVREDLRPLDTTSTGGRGFAIATNLARSLHVERLPGRFRITAELPVKIRPDA